MQATQPKTWPAVENILKNAGVSFEQKEWFYLCKIKGIEFYYSPQTGKWRVKGKRAWKKSNSVQDFLNKAFKYTPPKPSSQDRSSKSRQEKQEKKQNNQKSKSKSKKKTERKTSDVDEIREELKDRFDYYLKIKRKRNYKIGWIWHKLIEEFVPTRREICWLCVVFDYAPYWAVHRIRDFYVPFLPKVILTIIEFNRDIWLEEFETRWGQREWQQTDKRDRQQQEQYKQNYRQQQENGTNTNQVYAFLYRRYLQILKITFPFTKAELKRAYRKMALETHPDSGGTSEAFRAVNSAYEVLLKHISR
ncbi:MAG: DnaJ domain-containing protein [Prochloraceae cyanobacterium]